MWMDLLVVLVGVLPLVIESRRARANGLFEVRDQRPIFSPVRIEAEPAVLPPRLRGLARGAADGGEPPIG